METAPAAEFDVSILYGDNDGIGHHTADEKCKVTVRRFDCQLTLCFDSYVLSYIHTCAAGAFKRKCLRGSDFQTFELVIDGIAFS